MTGNYKCKIYKNSTLKLLKEITVSRQLRDDLETNNTNNFLIKQKGMDNTLRECK